MNLVCYIVVIDVLGVFSVCVCVCCELNVCFRGIVAIVDGPCLLVTRAVPEKIFVENT